jgi:hypothetical protein
MEGSLFFLQTTFLNLRPRLGVFSAKYGFPLHVCVNEVHLVPQILSHQKLE